MKIEIDVQSCKRKFFFMPGTVGTGTTDNEEPLELLVAGRDIYIAIGASVKKRHYLLKLDDIVTMVAELDDQLMREKREERRDFLLVIDEAAGMIKEFNNRAKEEDEDDLNGNED